MSLLQTYLTNLQAVQQSGKATDERSYYGPLNTLFVELGATLQPKVQPIQEVSSEGDNIHPDFLLQDTSNGDIRLAVEVKGAADDLDRIITSEQVSRYLDRYGVCLVTNLREFALIEGNQSTRHHRMRLALAPNERAFWSLRSGSVDAALTVQFEDLLLSALTWNAQITRPPDLAATLARYAREALRRLEQQPAEALDALRKTLSDALGLHFETIEGEHFFRSSLVQTLFYGLFSAWVACHQRSECEDFRWREAGDYLGLPLVRELFEEIAKASQLERFDIRKPLEWAEAALNRTVWENFDWSFQRGEAINYFYEPFLEAFDPDLRRQLGVWYTPREIVRYMVARVDTVLREELGIADGLANPRVVILDPCCGTGAYPVEVLRFITERLRENGSEALLGAKVKQAATSRVFGFEIMPAPFVIAHLQIGMLLADLNAPLNDSQRAGVYLTNALTGWEAATPLGLPGFPALQQESEASKRIKQQEQIIVILGNPPYNGYTGVAFDEERMHTHPYRITKRTPAPRGRGLNNLYARFFGMADRRIVERTGQGVVCFISDNSWLTEPSFPGMREHYLEGFDKIYVDNLNGDKFRTGKLTPDGKPDPSVFSTTTTPEGIQVGTAISTLVRNADHRPSKNVLYRDFWGVDKRKLLQEENKPEYTELTPIAEIGLPFAPRIVGANYLSWPSLVEIFPANFSGVNTARDAFVVDIDRDSLVRRILQYFDPSVSVEMMRTIAPSAVEKTGRFDAEKVRPYLQKRGFLEQYVVRYCYRPFDVRWIYWEPETKLIEEKRAEYYPHIFSGNVWLEARRREALDRFDRGYVTQSLADKFGNGLSSFFPLYLRDDVFGKQLNLSSAAQKYYSVLDVSEAELLFYHALAVMHTPEYRLENSGALRQDWPRIPLPSAASQLSTSSALGKQIASLLDLESDISNYTKNAEAQFRQIARVVRVNGGQLNPDTDLNVTAHWGSRGQGGVAMPGTGRLTERAYTPEEAALINPDLLGATTFDIFLNEVAYWRNIPKRVWEYTIGGYQVIKKWLSYREFALLGRPLKMEEVEEVTNIARRIAAILLLEPQLDANYEAVKAATVSL